jgi:hypothetical protein
MISHASELLHYFIESEKQKLKDVYMPHMPTLGSAYEEITKQGLAKNFVIPKALDLRVVSGFVEIAEEILPQQIDCMLVRGEGRRYGITEQYIYNIDQILCLFEVKKSLSKNDYFDAFNHLGAVRRKYVRYFEDKLRSGQVTPDLSHARKIFSQITGKIAPTNYSDIHTLPEQDGILFYTLVMEAEAPICIINGFGGYKTESGFRAAFVEMIEEGVKINGAGFGVPSFPTLVTSNNFCLIKCNGSPYLATKGPNSWVAIASTRHNPVKIILELIWSKISIYCDVTMPWGLDLDMETLAPLLFAEVGKQGEQVGWAFRSIEPKEKQLNRGEANSWHPEKVGSPEMAVISIMAMSGGYLQLDQKLSEYLINSHKCTIDQVVNNLILSKAFAKEGNYLRPIASLTHVLTNADGTGYIADNRNRFDAWCAINSIAPAYMNLVFMGDYDDGDLAPA